MRGRLLRRESLPEVREELALLDRLPGRGAQECRDHFAHAVVGQSDDRHLTEYLLSVWAAQVAGVLHEQKSKRYGLKN